jgi:hypothetical protein
MMKPLLLALCALPSIALALTPTEPKALAAAAADLLIRRCAECHDADASSDFTQAKDLAALAKSPLVNTAQPPLSRLYQYVEGNSCPRTTKADKQAGTGKKPLSKDEKDLLMAWIRDGAPDTDGKSGVAATVAPAAGNGLGRSNAVATGADVLAAPSTTATPEPPPGDLPAKRPILSEAQVIAAAVEDLLGLPPEDRAGTRYLSIHPQHNNVSQINDSDLWLTRCAIRKMLNSLSSAPVIALFEKVGPEQVLHRVRLKDIGWSPSQWDRITAIYPYALGGDGLRSPGRAGRLVRQCGDEAPFL